MSSMTRSFWVVSEKPRPFHIICLDVRKVFHEIAYYSEVPPYHTQAGLMLIFYSPLETDLGHSNQVRLYHLLVFPRLS